MIDFSPIFTDAGQAAIAGNTAHPAAITITHIVLGTGRYGVRAKNGAALAKAAARTTLLDERLRMPVVAGSNLKPGTATLSATASRSGTTDPDMLVLQAEIPAATGSTEEFFIHEIGLMDGNGNLIALWSDATRHLGFRGQAGGWLLSLNFAWDAAPASGLSVPAPADPSSAAAQIPDTVEAAGMVYDAGDEAQPDTAIRTRLANPEEIQTPRTLTPADGASDVEFRPTLVGDAFFSPAGFAHTSSQFQIEAIANNKGPLNTIIHDTGALHSSVALGGVTRYTIPESVDFAHGTSYRWRLRYGGTLTQGDAQRMTQSAWSAWSSFKTGIPLVYPPKIGYPLNGESGIGKTPTFAASPFTTNLSSDTHQKSQWQIARDAAFTDIILDSEVTSGDLTRLDVPGDILDADTTYHLRARYFGVALGASNWSLAIRFATQPRFVCVAAPQVTSPQRLGNISLRYPLVTLGAFTVTGGGTDRHAGTQIQIRHRNSNTTFHDSGELQGPVTRYRLPDSAPLAAGTPYLLRARYRGASLGWSEGSDIISFGTTARLTSIVTPSITAPRANQTLNTVTPTITWGAFAVTNGTDTHEASQVQIRAAGDADWSAPLYDTGLPGNPGALGDVTRHTVPADAGLAFATNYLIRLRVRGSGSGWSGWSAEVAFTAVAVAAGEVVFARPGRYSWVVPEGMTSVSVVCVGGGGGGSTSPFSRNLPSGGGGGGGGLAWKNDIPVTPGARMTVVVGERGAPGARPVRRISQRGPAPSGFSSDRRGGNGGSSSFAGIVTAQGGTGGGRNNNEATRGGGYSVIGGGGGHGGAGGRNVTGSSGSLGGGGGAGGYRGSGGRGGGADGGPTAGAGGGGGGGILQRRRSAYSSALAGNGGGVSIYGAGPSGAAGTARSASGKGGSGGRSSVYATGGDYGGGGGARISATRRGRATYYVGSLGALGCVRIIWGSGRTFPDNAGLTPGYARARPGARQNILAPRS